MKDMRKGRQVFLEWMIWWMLETLTEIPHQRSSLGELGQVSFVCSPLRICVVSLQGILQYDKALGRALGWDMV